MTKEILKEVTNFDTSNFIAESDLTSLKPEVDKKDIDKLL